MGFVGIHEPADLAPHRPLYAQCLYRQDESQQEKSGLTKGRAVPKYKRLYAKRPSGNCQTRVLCCGVPPMSHRNSDFIEEVPIRSSF